MQLELTGRHLAITPALRRLVTTKITKLERKLNDSAVSVHVVLAREKHRHLTEINLHARGEHFLHAVGNAPTWEASLSDALDKIDQQVVKVKGRWQERKRRGGRADGFVPVEPAEVPAPSRGARVRPRMPRVLHSSRQPIQVMSVADAARTLDGDRDGVVVFLDPETAAINVLYRRQTGELSLLEIEI